MPLVGEAVAGVAPKPPAPTCSAAAHPDEPLPAPGRHLAGCQPPSFASVIGGRSGPLARGRAGRGSTAAAAFGG
eukprot:6311647-Lingulodinium_polyedra.AAC.1